MVASPHCLALLSFLCSALLNRVVAFQAYRDNLAIGKGYNRTSLDSDFHEFITCSPLEAPQNGSFVIDNSSEIMKATFTCDKDYDLKGPAEINCRFGNWADQPPICIRKRITADKVTPVVAYVLAFVGILLIVIVIFVCPCMSQWNKHATPGEPKILDAYATESLLGQPVAFDESLPDFSFPAHFHQHF